MLICLLNFILFLSLNIYDVSASEKCFRAAVYEHVPIETPFKEPLKLLNNNYKIYKKVIRKAAEFNTSIIQFPEYGLFPPLSKTVILSAGVASIIPDLDTNLCEEYNKEINYLNSKNGLDFLFRIQEVQEESKDKETKKIDKDVRANIVLLRKLSCLASKHNIFISTDLIELAKKKKDYLLYNTNIVFDNHGKLVSKYRKFKMSGESAMTRLEEPEYATFDTDFGRFGTVICFDLLFKNPVENLIEKEKIDHLLYPTAWFDTEPSLSALNLHSAAAFKYGINILSANKRHLKIGAHGSGIFTKNGAKVQTTFNNRDFLMIADLPVAGSNANEDDCSYTNKVEISDEIYKKHSDLLNENTYYSTYKPKHTSFDAFEHKKLKTKEGNLTNVCYKDVCCDLTWKMNDDFEFGQDKFYLIATSRVKMTMTNTDSFYEENCVLVSYHKKQKKYKLFTSTHFDKIVLKGRFKTDVIYPNVLSNGLKIVSKKNWSFKQNGTEAEISVGNLEESIKSVTLYGRNYKKDPKK